MFKRKPKEEIDITAKAFNKMLMDVISKQSKMEKIYLEVKRNGLIGPFLGPDFDSILNWCEGKQEAYFLMKIEVYEKFHLYEALNKKQLRLKNVVDALGKSLDKLKIYVDDTILILERAGQIKK